MAENRKRNIAKSIDMGLFVAMMLGVLFCIENSDSALFLPIIILVVCFAIYFMVKGIINMRNTNPANEDEEEITKLNFMHRSRAVGVCIACIVKAEGDTSPEELDKYLIKTQACNERISNLWRGYLEGDDIDLKKACDWLFKNLDNRECYVTVEYMFDMAHFVKKITDVAWEYLYEMMKRLKITDEDMKYLRNKYAVFYNQEPDATERDKAFRLLGVSTDASIDDINEAFSKLAKYYQPDGLTDVNLVKYTNVKLQEINKAHILLTESAQ